MLERGVASVGEPVSEVIGAVVGIQKFTTPLGVASAPLQSKTRPELAIQQNDLITAPLRRNKPENAVLKVLEHLGGAPVVKRERDIILYE